MKTLKNIRALAGLLSFTFLILNFECARAESISSYPNLASPPGNYLFLMANPGVTNYNVSVAQMPSALGLPSLFDSLGAGTTAATLATNGFPWGSLYDPINTAKNATNGLWGNVVVQVNTASNALNSATVTLGANLTNDVNSTSNALQSQITSGGITAQVGTNIVNGLTGVVATNGTNLTLQFTATGTNSITAIAQPLVNSASNSLVTTATAAATAATNGMGIGTGISAFVPTNRFAAASQMLGTTNLAANQYCAFDGNTNVTATLNGNLWTNLDAPHFTNYGTITNITLPADGNSWRVLVTNGPNIFLNFGGPNMGAISLWVTTNSTTTWPPYVKMLGYSNHLTTNCLLDFQPWGGSNNVVGAQSEF